MKYPTSYLSTLVCGCLLAASASKISAAVSSTGVAIIGFNANNSTGFNDAVSWIALETIAAGETLYFSDISYTGSAFDNDNIAVEFLYRYIAPSGGIAAGSVQTFHSGDIDGGSYTELTDTAYDGGPFTGFMEQGGDQILVFQDDDVSNETNFNGLFAIDFNSTGWSYDGTNDFDQSSSLYPGMTDGVNAINLGEFSGGRYTGTTTGSAAFLQSQIADTSNWDTTNNQTDITAGGLTWTSNGVSNFAVVPEPGSVALLGIASLTTVLRRRR